MRSQGNFDLSALTSDEDAAIEANKVSSFISANGDFVKANAQQFLDACYNQLTSPETSPISKCMTLHVLKELTYKSETKVFSLLSLNKTLDFLQTEARTIDPKKPIHEKGAKRFPNSPDIGKEYMRLMLELLQCWSEKFGKGKNSEPTKYKKNILDLKKEGVILPEEYIYIDQSRLKKSKKVTKEQPSPLSIPSPKSPMNETPPAGGDAGGKSMLTELRYTRDKANIFLGELEDEEDPDQIQNKIENNHGFFKKELQKYEQKMGDLEKNNASQEETMLFFKVFDFLQKENDFYNRHISNNRDVKSYLDELKLASDENGMLSKDIPLEQPKSKIERRGPASNPKMEAPPPPSQASKQTVSVLNKGILNAVYDRFASRSKSPDIGFKAVQKQLEKEKQIAKKNPLRSTSRSPKPINGSALGGSRSTKNLGQSRVSAIFANPPNMDIEPKTFQGELIPTNRDLSRVIFNIKKEQGIKRFKTSNLKDKSPLFQNDHIQIGYKTQAVYDTIGGFSQFICINIFIGNKTDQVIKDFQVEYKGDANQLLYANPRSVDSLIPAGYQNKHDLLVTPLRLPYSLLTMHISYRFQNSELLTSIVLPNSILKFASYMKISKQEFKESWRDAEKFKTAAFPLCKNLPPDSFSKYIPALEYLTQYNDFAAPGSQTDLEMFCKIIMLQKYEAILKIVVRPNLQAVVQVGSLEGSSEALEYFTCYLETMELVMKEINI